MSLDFDVFAVDSKPVPGSVPGFRGSGGPGYLAAFHVSSIWDEGGGLLVDCLMTGRVGEELVMWVGSHDCEPGYVYITHPHAGHFLGLPEVLAAFPGCRAGGLAESVPAMEGQISPGLM